MKRGNQDEFDLIRLNLQRFDALTNRISLIDRTFSTAPILPFTIAFALGILLTYHVQSPRTIWAAAGSATLFAGLCFLLTLKTKARLRLALALTAACLAVLALGTVRSALIIDTPPQHITHYLDDERQLATLKGKVVSSIRTDAFQAGFRRFRG